MAERGKGAKLRAAAALTVDAVVTGGRSLDAALEEFECRVAAVDRSLLRLLVYGALRRHWRLAAWIERLVERPVRPRDAVINALLAVGLYQLTETRIPDHAVVSQTVAAVRVLRRPKFAPLVNAVLRRFLRDRIADEPPSNDMAAFDHPQWLIDRIRGDWPKHWQDILAANNARAPMWLRVNSRRVTAVDYLERLAEADMRGALLDGVPQAVRLEQPQPVAALPGFAAGDVSVQDAAAQLAAPWLLGGVEGRVLDACAAPGGKSGHLMELAGDRIELCCMDIDATRLEGARQNLERLGCAATFVCADAAKPDAWWDRRPFAAILLDAPCSATGVIRRHPDIKILRRETDIAALRHRQAALLDALWPLLAPGGTLLYVTCSVLRAENDAVIDAFVAGHGDARENDVLPNNNIHALMQRQAAGYQVLPGTAGLDGFYFACLHKVS